jgi:chorismate mutase/prephenate dehydratase
MSTEIIHSLRKKIDSLDKKILRLLNQRAAIAVKIGKLKKKSKTQTYSPEREKIILKNITKSNSGPLPRSSLVAIYREIMSASLALEKNICVAYLGPQASFSHQAAMRRFGSSIAYAPCDNIDDVFETVQSGNADYGVVPIENLIEGSVTNTLDCLTATGLKVCAEICQPVSHCLMAAGPREGIKRIMSNPYVFGQCRKWLRSEMPGIELVPVPSTTRAAELAAGNRRVAAIASKLAADMYKLKILAKDIQDVRENITRFLVIGKSFGKKTGDDKTSILFSVKHRAGSLHEALGSLRKYKLNMTRIESRPSRLKAWEYLFFADIEGHIEDPGVRKALLDLEKHSQHMTVLGSYPKTME